jgi:hypothetical protein
MMAPDELIVTPVKLPSLVMVALTALDENEAPP